MTRFRLAILLGVSFSLLAGRPSAQAPPAATWYRGNIHTHTINSDGDSPPYDVVAWYKRNGYQFLSITDHNTFTDPALFDTNPNDRFLLIGGEEVTNGRSVHVNGIGISKVIPAQSGATPTEILQSSINAIRAQGGIPIINHPNWNWAFGAAEIRPLKDVGLLEISNSHPAVNHAGDGRTPSTEQMWDELLSSGMRIHAVAVDDVHNFRKEFSIDDGAPGRGWVMVRASALTRDAIVEALARGDFYTSTGVQLKDVRSTATSLTIEVQPPPPPDNGQRRYRVVFIGAGGRTLNVSHESPATYTFTGNEGYVRARVEDSSGFRAWTQATPVGRPVSTASVNR